MHTLVRLAGQLGVAPGVLINEEFDLELLDAGIMRRLPLVGHLPKYDQEALAALIDIFLGVRHWFEARQSPAGVVRKAAF